MISAPSAFPLFSPISTSHYSNMLCCYFRITNGRCSCKHSISIQRKKEEEGQKPVATKVSSLILKTKTKTKKNSNKNILKEESQLAWHGPWVYLWAKPFVHRHSMLLLARFEWDVHSWGYGGGYIMGRWSDNEILTIFRLWILSGMYLNCESHLSW